MSRKPSLTPTIVDVAKESGVSVATASRALSRYGRVSVATIEKVQAAAAKLGYRPNQVAASMRAGKTKTIGLVVIADFTNAFFDRATKAIVDSARAKGYQVLITNTDEDVEAEKNAVATLLEKQVDGLIIVPSTNAVHDHLKPEQLNGKPVVLIDRKLDFLNLSSVTTDDFSGSRDAIVHAVSLGHQRFGFLIATENVTGFTTEEPASLISPIEERILGFRQGAKDSGIPAKNLSWRFSRDSVSVAEDAARNLIDDKLQPTIVLASNNDMALAVLKVSGQRQLALGKDISLITVDDSPWAEAMAPGITVVSRPVQDLGEKAVEELISQIEGESTIARKIVLPTELVARGSVANLVLRPELDPRNNS